MMVARIYFVMSKNDVGTDCVVVWNGTDPMGKFIRVPPKKAVDEKYVWVVSNNLETAKEYVNDIKDECPNWSIFIRSSPALEKLHRQNGS